MGDITDKMHKIFNRYDILGDDIFNSIKKGMLTNSHYLEDFSEIIDGFMNKNY